MQAAAEGVLGDIGVNVHLVVRIALMNNTAFPLPSIDYNFDPVTEFSLD